MWTIAQWKSHSFMSGKLPIEKCIDGEGSIECINRVYIQGYDKRRKGYIERLRYEEKIKREEEEGKGHSIKP